MAANPNFKVNKFKQFLAKALRPILKLGGKKFYVSLQYRYITGRKLSWKTLKRYTEKLQYLRLYTFPFDNEVIRATSRVSARVRVINSGFKDILIPLIGVYYDVDDIDFAKLPKRFVIKGIHACAFNYICTDKSKLNVPQLKKQLNKWLRIDYGKLTIEPHYSPIRPGFIIEEYIGHPRALPPEYKIHVFNGRARYLYIVSNRNNDIRYDNFYIDFTPFNEAQFNDWQSSDTPPKKPDNYDEIVHIAEQLASDFVYCRVDFFLVDNKLYFNEFTFTPAKGTLRFADDSADYKIGQWLVIPSATLNTEA